MHDKNSPAFAHNRHISVRPALKQRGSQMSNIWIFDSPKNDARLQIEGDPHFMYAVLLEGDIETTRYTIRAPISLAESSRNSKTKKVDVVRYLADGTQEWIDFGAAHSGTRRSSTTNGETNEIAATAGALYRTISLQSFVEKHLLFTNWLTLCAAITRCRHQSSHKEVMFVKKQLFSQRVATLGALLDGADVDPAIVLGVVAKMLQTGDLTADLERQLFGKSSFVSWRSV